MRQMKRISRERERERERDGEREREREREGEGGREGDRDRLLPVPSDGERGVRGHTYKTSANFQVFWTPLPLVQILY